MGLFLIQNISIYFEICHHSLTKQAGMNVGNIIDVFIFSSEVYVSELKYSAGCA